MPPGVSAGRVVLAFTPEGETRTGGSRDTPEYLRRKAMEWKDAGLFKLHAEELNREAEDVLKYQVDIFDLIPPPRMNHEAGRIVPGLPGWAL